MRTLLPPLWLVASFGCATETEPFACPDGTDPVDFFRDDDGDGFGRSDRARPACEAPAGFVAVAGDCLDDDPSSFPGGVERCDTLDNDCDGTADEEVPEPDVWFADTDGDGFGDVSVTAVQCGAPEGFVADDTDCDDTDGATFPGADERCDGEDQDCDGSTDEDAVDAPEWFPDDDADGYGDGARGIVSCASPGWLLGGEDCDDADPDVHPGVEETCDDVDRDCSGDAYDDAVDGAVWFEDNDGDGYGTDVTTTACAQPVGFAAVAGDCDDGAGAIHPGAPEHCDRVDHDCDGETFDAESVDALTLYTDADGDSFGDPAATVLACRPAAGVVEDDTDCDDADAATFPGAADACDGVDHDCDGTVDEDDSVGAPSWYADTDGDGYGDPGASVAACTQPAGLLADACDCDDTDAAYNPEGLDCIAVACAGGAEVFLDDTCGLREITAEVAGTAAAPGTLSITEPGTVTFCPGTHYVVVDAAADTTLLGAEGADVTTLAAAYGTGVTFTGALVVDGLTLAEGFATSGGAAIAGAGALTLIESVVAGAEVDGSSGAVIDVVGEIGLVDSEVRDNVAAYTSASSVTCELAVVAATGDVTLDGATLQDNTLACEAGGGLYAASELRGSVLRVGGDLLADGSTLADNTITVTAAGMSSTMDGGGAAWVAGDAAFADSAVTGNAVEAALDCQWATCERAVYGAGLRVDGDTTLVDTLVAGNVSAATGSDGWGTPTLRTYGGGLYAGGSVACTSTGGDHGFTGNEAGSGGGLYWATTDPLATLTSAGCDWTGAADNTPDDVAGAATWSGGDEATFSCSGSGGCAP